MRLTIGDLKAAAPTDAAARWLLRLLISGERAASTTTGKTRNTKKKTEKVKR